MKKSFLIKLLILLSFVAGGTIYAASLHNVQSDPTIGGMKDSRPSPAPQAVKALLEKNSGRVARLGFTEAQLESIIYVSWNWGQDYNRYSTLEEYLALMYELPNFKSITRIDDGHYFGFKVKLSGQPYTGFVFRMYGDELYLEGSVAGDEIINDKAQGELTSEFTRDAAWVLAHRESAI